MVIFRGLPDGLCRHEHKLLIESIRCLFCFLLFNRDSRGKTQSVLVTEAVALFLSRKQITCVGNCMKQSAFVNH